MRSLANSSSGQDDPIGKVALFTEVASRGAFGSALSGLAWALIASSADSVEVEVLYYSEHVDPKANAYPKGVTFKKLPGGRGLRVIPHLRRYLNSDQPAFLISAPIYVNLISIIACAFSKWRRLGGKLVITHHHPIRLSHRNSFKDNRWLARLLYRFASGSFGVSPGSVSEACVEAGLDPKEVPCIPNVLTPICLPAEADLHPWLNSKDGFTFLTVGRLVELKRVELLIQAFADVARVRSVQLVVCGSGPQRALLEELVARLGLQTQVAFCGHVDEPRLFMRSADAFVLASDEEGFGQVLVEAMSVGCPVIATRAQGGGTAFVLGEGDYGLLVPRGDRGELANAMLKIMNTDVREAYAQKSIQRARHFAPESIGETLISFLRSVKRRGDTLPPVDAAADT